VFIEWLHNAPEALDVESWSLIIEAINTPTEVRKEDETICNNKRIEERRREERR
jgi:hypothetical protein